MSRALFRSLMLVALALYPIHAQCQVSRFVLAGHEVDVVGDLGGFELSVGVATETPGGEIARIHLVSSAPTEPPAFSLRWAMPSHDVQGYWSTAAGLDKTIGPDWFPSRVRSTLARNAPVVQSRLIAEDETVADRHRRDGSVAHPFPGRFRSPPQD